MHVKVSGKLRVTDQVGIVIGANKFNSMRPSYSFQGQENQSGRSKTLGQSEEAQGPTDHLAPGLDCPHLHHQLAPCQLSQCCPGSWILLHIIQVHNPQVLCFQFLTRPHCSSSLYPEGDDNLFRTVFCVCHLLSLGSALVNPVLYGYFNKVGFQIKLVSIFQFIFSKGIQTRIL